MQTQHQLPKNAKVIEKLQKLIQNKKICRNSTGFQLV